MTKLTNLHWCLKTYFCSYSLPLVQIPPPTCSFNEYKKLYCHVLFLPIQNCHHLINLYLKEHFYFRNLIDVYLFALSFFFIISLFLHLLYICFKGPHLTQNIFPYKKIADLGCLPLCVIYIDCFTRNSPIFYFVKIPLD